jgi:hypothetical protein
MMAKYIAFSVKAALAGALIWSASAFPAAAVEIGPYFPLPNSFAITGSAKDSLLHQMNAWLTDGLERLKKARAEAGVAEDKAKALDQQIENASKEQAVLADETEAKEVQRERKRLFLLNLNRWINGLNKAATEQMKIAIMSDGAVAQTAEHRNYQLSQQADELENAKRDPSIESWAVEK